MERFVEVYPDEGREYAGFWIRFGANIIDGIIIGIPTGILMTIVNLIWLGSMSSVQEDMLDPNYEPGGGEILAFMGGTFITLFLAILISFLYYTLLHSSKWQGTVGKKLLNIKVVDLNGNRIGFGKAAGRYFATIISGVILYIGYIMAGFTEKKQALHDMIVGTLVVKK
ncbi:RDD family protein [Peribacillus sp. NPDC097206]|uniref:RDD family protein n=1 Tax=Peribacillus sp. NPDC097206 TaxID=3364398 RepID=UPI003801B6F3